MENTGAKMTQPEPPPFQPYQQAHR
jgi:hypothetical protein